MTKIILHRRAEIALRNIQGSEKDRILRALAVIESLPKRELLIHYNVHRLIGPFEYTYRYRATPKLRIIFTLEDEDTVLIQDIVSHDTLMRHFSLNNAK